MRPPQQRNAFAPSLGPSEVSTDKGKMFQLQAITLGALQIRVVHAFVITL
jgi:hypothetical protein